MNSKIKFIREKLNLTEKDVSSFLNISSYRYATFEKPGMDIPCEIILLLAKLYEINAEMIIDSKYTNEDILVELNNKNLLGNTTENLSYILKFNLLGNDTSVLSYRSIKKAKSIIQQNIINYLLSMLKYNNLSKHELATVLKIDVEKLESLFMKKRFITIDELITISKSFDTAISDIVMWAIWILYFVYFILFIYYCLQYY